MREILHESEREDTVLENYSKPVKYGRYNTSFRVVTDAEGTNWFVLEDLVKSIGWNSVEAYLQVFHQVMNPSDEMHWFEKCVIDGVACIVVRRSVALKMHDEMSWLLPEVRHCTLSNSNNLHNAIFTVKSRESDKPLTPTAQEMPPTPQEEDTLAKALAVIERLEARLDELEAKAHFAEATEASGECVNVAALAHKLTDNGCKVTRNALFAKLREDGFLSDDENTWNQPTKTSLEQGLFSLKTTTTRTGKGGYKIYTVPLITGKGQVYFINRYCGKGE